MTELLLEGSDRRHLRAGVIYFAGRKIRYLWHESEQSAHLWDDVSFRSICGIGPVVGIGLVVGPILVMSLTYLLPLTYQHHFERQGRRLLLS